MSMRTISAGLAGAVLFVVIPFAVARPPDLPLDTKDVCIPVILPQWLWQQPQYIPPSPPFPQSKELQGIEHLLAKPAESKPEIDLRKLAEARRLFRIGERCRRDGDLDMAVSCYQETELLYPDCVYARLAAERLRQLLPEVSATNAQQPSRDVIRETEADLARLADAKHMYEIGERCERGGDLDSARRCYEEAHRICPASRYGKEALERVMSLEKEGWIIESPTAQQWQELLEQERQKEARDQKLRSSVKP